jgi:chromosome partitioning protein
MDGNEKRRGRRLFASRRRQEDEDAVTPDPEASVEAGTTEEPVTGGSISPSDPAPATGDSGAPPAALGGRVQPPGAAAGVGEAGNGEARVGAVPAEAAALGEPSLVATPPPGPQSVTEMLAQAAAEPVAPLGAAVGSSGQAGPAQPEPRPEVAPAPVPDPSTAEAEAGVDAELAAAPEDQAEDQGEDEEEDLSYELPRILAIANQKGGVGKTTTSVNLGASLAELGYRVLVVDLDPQGNASTGLGINARNLSGSIYDVIMNDAPLEDCVEPTSLKNLFLAPATIDLAGAEIELVPAFSRELKLRRALESVRDEYDYMIIDCPPSLGLLTVNGLAAADDVIVPIQCEYYALEGLSQLVRNVTLVQTNLNPKLDVRGIVLTMYDARTKLADQVEKEVRLHFGRRVYQTVVPRTVRLSEAPSFGQPIILFDPTSRGAVAYRELAKEVSSGATRRTG